MTTINQSPPVIRDKIRFNQNLIFFLRTNTVCVSVRDSTAQPRATYLATKASKTNHFPSVSKNPKRKQTRSKTHAGTGNKHGR